MQKVMRIKEVIACIGLARSTVYAMCAAGTFPKPISLNKRAVGWRADQVEEWLATRPAVKSE